MAGCPSTDRRAPGAHYGGTQRARRHTKRKSDEAEAHARYPWGGIVSHAATRTQLVLPWDMEQDTRCQRSTYVNDPEHPSATLSSCHFCAAVFCSTCVPGIPAHRPMGVRYACDLCSVEWGQALQTHRPDLLSQLSRHDIHAAAPAPEPVDERDDSSTSSDESANTERPPPEHHNFVGSSNRVVPFFHTHKLRPACPLCGLPGEDPAHYILSCTHPALAGARATVQSSVSTFVQNLERDCRKAMEASAARGNRSSNAALPQLPHLPVAAFDWNSTEGQFVLYKLLLTATWPESSAPRNLS